MKLKSKIEGPNNFHEIEGHFEIAISCEDFSYIQAEYGCRSPDGQQIKPDYPAEIEIGEIIVLQPFKFTSDESEISVYIWDIPESERVFAELVNYETLSSEWISQYEDYLQDQRDQTSIESYEARKKYDY